MKQMDANRNYMILECEFPVPDTFKYSKKGYAKFENGILVSNSIRHSLMFDKEAMNLFSKDNISLKKSIIKDFKISRDRIKRINIEGFSYNLPSLILGIVLPILMLGFSYLTDSIFIWNSLIYLFVFIFYTLMFFKGKTSVIIHISPLESEESYEFEIFGLGRCPQLIIFGENLKEILK